MSQSGLTNKCLQFNSGDFTSHVAPAYASEVRRGFPAYAYQTDINFQQTTQNSPSWGRAHKKILFSCRSRAHSGLLLPCRSRARSGLLYLYILLTSRSLNLCPSSGFRGLRAQRRTKAMGIYSHNTPVLKPWKLKLLSRPHSSLWNSNGSHRQWD